MQKWLTKLITKQNFFKIHVIENWVDTKFIKPIKINNPFIIENNLQNNLLFYMRVHLEQHMMLKNNFML